MHLSKIAFRVQGKGPLLVLLHGYGGSPHHWTDVVPLLAKEYRVVVPNLSHIYMGREAFSFSEQVNILGDFITEHFPGEVVNLAGLSYGAALVWAFALKFPERVDKTVFINPMPPSPVSSFSIRSIRAMFRFPITLPAAYMVLRTPFGRLFLRKATQTFRVERADQVDRLDQLHGRKLLFVSHIVHRFSWIVRHENWSVWDERMEHWAHPSLFLYDKADPLFCEESYLELAEKLSCEKIATIEGGGHIATFNKGPDVAKHIHSFFKRYSDSPKGSKKTA